MWFCPRACLRLPRGTPRSRSYGIGGRPVQAFAALRRITFVCAALCGTSAILAVGAAAGAAEQPLKIVALGDSLTAGLGLAADQTFPAKLEHALKVKGYAVTV